MIIVLRTVHARAHEIFFHQSGIARLQTTRDAPGICNVRIRPKIVVIWSQNHRHPIIYIGDQRVWFRRKMDFTALDRMDVAPCNGRQLSDNDLNTVEIDRRDVGHVRKAGDFILRIGYHEAVHAGQMLQYLINLSAKGKHSELAAEPATSLSWLTPPSSREDAMYELSADGICVPLFGLQ